MKDTIEIAESMTNKQRQMLIIELLEVLLGGEGTAQEDRNKIAIVIKKEIKG